METNIFSFVLRQESQKYEGIAYMVVGRQDTLSKAAAKNFSIIYLANTRKN